MIVIICILRECKLQKIDTATLQCMSFELIGHLGQMAWHLLNVCIINKCFIYNDHDH